MTAKEPALERASFAQRLQLAATAECRDHHRASAYLGALWQLAPHGCMMRSVIPRASADCSILFRQFGTAMFVFAPARQAQWPSGHQSTPDLISLGPYLSSRHHFQQESFLRSLPTGPSQRSPRRVSVSVEQAAIGPCFLRSLASSVQIRAANVLAVIVSSFSQQSILALKTDSATRSQTRQHSPRCFHCRVSQRLGAVRCRR